MDVFIPFIFIPKINGNPVTSDGALSILSAIDAMCETSLRELHLKVNNHHFNERIKELNKGYVCSKLDPIYFWYRCALRLYEVSHI